MPFGERPFACVAALDEGVVVHSLIHGMKNPTVDGNFFGGRCMQGLCMQGFVGEDDMKRATTTRAERTERGDIGKRIGK